MTEEQERLLVAIGEGLALLLMRHEIPGRGPAILDALQEVKAKRRRREERRDYQ